MSDRQKRAQLIASNEVVAAPVERACHDQSFELPLGIYVAMAAMFTGFVAVLALAFRGGHMPVVVGVILAFIAAFFAVPALFPRIAATAGRSPALSWSEFRESGVQTATGCATARQATILVLLLPFLILGFAIAVVGIASWMP